MKRFYKLVTTMGDEERGFVIHLDGKAVKTPGGNTLLLPTQPIADALAEEWRAQDEEIDPENMPITQIMTTAIDHVIPAREEIMEKVMAYLTTDLLCYQAKSPAALVKRQEAMWDPWLRWFEKRFKSILIITTDVQAVTQPPEAIDAVERRVRYMDDLQFTVLQFVTVATGSLVLALAFMEGAASADSLYNAASVEEIYKAEIYEEDKHGEAPDQKKRREELLRDLEAAKKFLGLLKEKKNDESR